MKLAGCSWSFLGTNLVESANIWRALGVQAMDLLVQPDLPFPAALIERDPSGFARTFREPEMELINMIAILGRDFADRANNTTDRAVWAQNLDTYKRLFDCCVEAQVRSMTVTPGIDQPGLSHADSMTLAGERLQELTSLARRVGVGLVFEPHVDSVLESPLETLEFLQAHPDLKIVLDYSHFVSVGYRPEEVDPLIPYADHVHLRQGANGKLQARWEEGEVDFKKVVQLLGEAGYSGYLAFEYEHDDWQQMDRCDVMTETIKMRDAISPLL